MCVCAVQRMQVAGMVQPGVVAADVCKFFWDHLCRDLEVLQRALGRSADDVYLVLHHLAHLIATLQSGGQLGLDGGWGVGVWGARV